MREEWFTEDGDSLSWHAQDGLLYLELTPADESHTHRFVWSPEDVAPMLLRAYESGGVQVISRATEALIIALRMCVQQRDAVTQ